MVYRGDLGFMTSESEALVLLYCNSRVTPCGDCFNVQGPPQSEVRVLQDREADSVTSHYSVYIKWPVTYTGQISVAALQER